MSQSLPSSQGSLEERFAHILQPIRDLAKNWDIDVANYLEEYLEDLEKVTITFDDGTTTMNFSEAALLIQGSAGVYAKKVEYLYTLVYQVLDLVTQNKRQKKQTDKDTEGDGEGTNQNEEEEFLSLDDAVEGEDCNFIKEQDTASNKSVMPVPEMPIRLIPLEESEKGDNPIYNKKGEVLANFCDFNTNTGFCCPNGSLILELADLALVDHNLQSLAGHDGSRSRQEGLAENLMEEDGDGDPHFADNFEDELLDVNQGEAVEASQPDISNNNNNNDNTQEAQTGKRNKKKVTFGEAPGDTDKRRKKKDPLALLDPHAKSKAAEKPFKKKKTTKVPESLDDKTSKKRKKKASKQEEKLEPLYEVVEQLFSNRSKFPKNKLKVPELQELEEAFWEEHKLREKLKVEEMKELKRQGQEVEAEAEEDDERETPLGGGDDDNEDNDLGNELPFQLDDNLFRCDADSLRLRPSSTDTMSQDDGTVVSYEDMVQKHVEKFLASATEYAQITELSRRVAGWEEKIAPKLEEERSHPLFDIHKYGSVMIEKMVRGEKIAFRELVKEFPVYDICRYALAVLQLANAGNVELTVIPDETGNIIDRLFVTLQSTKRHYEDLQEYQAPSLKDT